MTTKTPQTSNLPHSFDIALDDKGPRMPDRLRASRQRSVLSKMFPSWPETGFMGLPVAASYHADITQIGGHVVEGVNGVGACIERRLIVGAEAQPYAPFVGRRQFIPFIPQMSPETSPADTLQSLLTPESWHLIEQAALLEAGGSCEVCGDGSQPCEAHELWEYRYPSSDEIEGVQRLERLICLCPDCHQMMHPAVALLEGREADWLSWLKSVNEFSDDEAREAFEVVRLRATHASRFDWVLDLSRLGTEIEIDSSWNIDESIWRFFPRHDFDPRGTLPLGISFQYRGEHYPRASTDEYYDLLDADGTPAPSGGTPFSAER